MLDPATINLDAIEKNPSVRALPYGLKASPDLADMGTTGKKEAIDQTEFTIGSIKKYLAMTVADAAVEEDEIAMAAPPADGVDPVGSPADEIAGG